MSADQTDSSGRGPGLFPEETFRLVCRSVPMACVDLLPWRSTDAGPEVLLIRRLDREEKLCWCWVGGRILLDETIQGAIARHLDETLGGAQHSIGLTYLVPGATGKVQAMGEAIDWGWFPVGALPEPGEFSFGHGPVVYELSSRLPQRG